MNRFAPLFFASIGTAFVAFTAFTASAQVIPFIEIQGESEASPYENQTVTVSGKVTEAFGDSWYMQDAYGAWNGLYVVGPDVLIPANVPYWNADRQPEVGDVLELTGTVVEDDGNTQLVDVELVEFVDFWNATPVGVWVSAAESQEEQHEGTRIRLENATVLTAPDADGYWNVALDDGEVTCWGIDTYDPSGNEDPDGPTPGDVYLIYGASHQAGDAHVCHVGDIDVVSLGVASADPQPWRVYPNPVHAELTLDASSDAALPAVFCIGIWNAAGQLVHRETVGRESSRLLLEHLNPGAYALRMTDATTGAFVGAARFVKN